jgi:predicted RNA binding protein YcfA (HicA-like mRNA interferase family)
MPKSLTPRQLLKKLQTMGFKIDHTTGSHYILYHLLTKKRVVIAYHAKELPRGTIASILKEAGLTWKDLEK